MIRILAAVVLLFVSFCAHAQDALVVQTCGTLPLAYAAGATRPLTVDVNGKLCNSASATGINFTGNSTIAGATAANTSILFWNGLLRGNCTSVAGCFANTLSISDDSLTSTSLNGSGNLQVQTTIANSVNTGGVANFQSFLNITGLTGNAANQFFVSSNLWGQVSGNMGGTGTGANARGSVTAINPQQLCIGTATFLTECSVDEHDLVVGAGASANLVFGSKVVLGALNRTAGTSDSGGFLVAAASGATNTFACGYCFGQNGSDHGVASTGALIGANQAGGSAVALGIDFDKLPAFTTSVIRGPSAGTMNITTGPAQNFTVLDSSNGAKFRVAGAGAAVTAGLVVTPGTGGAGVVTLTQQGAGTGGITVNSAVGPLLLQGNGTTGIQVNTSGGVTITPVATAQSAVYMTGLASSAGAQIAFLCKDAQNQIIADTGATCIASSGRYKEAVDPLWDGLASVLRLVPVSFNYKKTGNPDFDNGVNRKARQVGFVAEQAETVDPRLVTYDRDGQPSGFRYESYVAVLTRAIQQQQKQIVELQRAVRRRH